jgi:hypothetical protein
MLRPFDVHSQRRTVDGETRRGYWLDQLADSFERLLPPPESSSKRPTVQNSSTKPIAGIFELSDESSLGQSENGRIPDNQAVLDAWTLGTGKEGNEVPLPGDDGFPSFSDKAAFRGLITCDENRERQRLHEAIVAARAASLVTSVGDNEEAA